MGIHDGWLKKVEVEMVKLEGELRRERYGGEKLMCDREGQTGEGERNRNNERIE